MSSLSTRNTARQGSVYVGGQALSPKGVEKIEERRERLFDSALEAEEDMKDRLKSVQSELEELRALGLEV